MTNDDRLRFPSPDGRHAAVLTYAGEVRFGPAWFTLAIDGRSFGSRAFGEAGLWSPDSRLFAAQEWMTTAEARGPYTVLLLIDWDGQRECASDAAHGGFIEPVAFEADVLVYTKTYYHTRGRAISKHRRDVATLPGWLPLALGRG